MISETSDGKTVIQLNDKKLRYTATSGSSYLEEYQPHSDSWVPVKPTEKKTEETKVEPNLSYAYNLDQHLRKEDTVEFAAVHIPKLRSLIDNKIDILGFTDNDEINVNVDGSLDVASIIKVNRIEVLFPEFLFKFYTTGKMELESNDQLSFKSNDIKFGKDINAKLFFNSNDVEFGTINTGTFTCYNSVFQLGGYQNLSNKCNINVFDQFRVRSKNIKFEPRIIEIGKYDSNAITGSNNPVKQGFGLLAQMGRNTDRIFSGIYYNTPYSDNLDFFNFLVDYRWSGDEENDTCSNVRETGTGKYTPSPNNLNLQFQPGPITDALNRSKLKFGWGKALKNFVIEGQLKHRNTKLHLGFQDENDDLVTSSPAFDKFETGFICDYYNRHPASSGHYYTGLLGFVDGTASPGPVSNQYFLFCNYKNSGRNIVDGDITNTTGGTFLNVTELSANKSSDLVKYGCLLGLKDLHAVNIKVMEGQFSALSDDGEYFQLLDNTVKVGRGDGDPGGKLEATLAVVGDSSLDKLTASDTAKFESDVIIETSTENSSTDLYLLVMDSNGKLHKSSFKISDFA